MLVVKHWDIQTVYCSPLTRAIQTACKAFEQESCPIYAWPVLTEMYPDMPECQGRNRSELEKSLLITSLKKYKDVRFDAVTKNWWYIAGEHDKRLLTFFSWLASCPETRIALVSHWGFLCTALEERARTRTALELHNCCHIRTLWKVPTILPLEEAAIDAQAPCYSIVVVPTSGGSDPISKHFFSEMTQLVQLLRERFKSDEIIYSNFPCMWLQRLPYIHLVSLGHVADQGLLARIADLICEVSSSTQRIDRQSHKEQLCFSDDNKIKYVRASEQNACTYYTLKSAILEHIANEAVAIVSSCNNNADDQQSFALNACIPSSKVDQLCNLYKQFNGARVIVAGCQCSKNGPDLHTLETICNVASTLPYANALIRNDFSLVSSSDLGSRPPLDNESFISHVFRKLDWEIRLIAHTESSSYADAVFKIRF